MKIKELSLGDNVIIKYYHSHLIFQLIKCVIGSEK